MPRISETIITWPSQSGPYPSSVAGQIWSVSSSFFPPYVPSFVHTNRSLTRPGISLTSQALGQLATDSIQVFLDALNTVIGYPRHWTCEAQRVERQTAEVEHRCGDTTDTGEHFLVNSASFLSDLV